jgi:hypothetical protein
MGADEPAGDRGRELTDTARSREPDRAGRSPITLEELERWVDHGATYQALEISDEHAVVEMRTCYGEPVDVREADAPELIEYLRSHRGD